MLLCGIIPLKYLPQNKENNVVIDNLNKLLNDYIADKPFYKMLALNKMIEQIPRYNSIYHDNVHLNYRNGIPWLKNQILQQLMSTSNVMCQSNEPDNEPLRQNRNPIGNRSRFNTILHTTTNTDGTTIPTGWVFEMKSTQWQMIIKTSQFFLWKLEWS